MKGTIIGLGEILWDVFPDGRKVLGGAPSNFAWHASQCGYEGVALSAIHHFDANGQEILQTLAEKGLTHLLETVPFDTGTVKVTLDETGTKPQYEICENVAWDNLPLTPRARELAQRARAVCFGTLAQRSPVSRQTIQALLDLLPADAYRVLDINLRQHYYSKEVIGQSLQKANVLKINDEEVIAIAPLFGLEGLTDTGACLELLRRYHLRMVILTRGGEGSSVILPSGEVLSHKPAPVKIADTVGAGDAFTAIFITGLLDGLPLCIAQIRANNIAAYVCTQRGGMPDLPGELLG